MGINFKQHMLCDLNNIQGSHEARDKNEIRTQGGEEETG
jgi:hypothetical protein